jgi:hypothetical protein
MHRKVGQAVRSATLAIAITVAITVAYGILPHR